MAADDGRPRARRLSRRQFIRLAALAGAAAGIQAGCSGRQAVEPTSTPSLAARAPTDVPATSIPTALPPTAAATSGAMPASATQAPSATMVPSPTLTPTPKPALGPLDVMKVYPAAPSAIVRATHPGVWSGGAREPLAMREMLDASITRLTGLNDAREAWAALFKPHERIAIKVNTIAGSSVWSNVPLVEAVIASLVASGMPAEQIVVYDRASYELKSAGFTINKDGPGARCIATDNDYTGRYDVAGASERLSKVLLSCDALINMPVLKQHSYSGVSFALKNHYGTVDSPGSLHSTATLNRALGDLGMLPDIRQRTRLIVGDALLYTASSGWDNPQHGDTLLMSCDPVACDALALQKLVDLKRAANQNPASQIARATPWLEGATRLGLGTHEEKNMDLMEVRLG